MFPITQVSEPRLERRVVKFFNLGGGIGNAGGTGNGNPVGRRGIVEGNVGRSILFDVVNFTGFIVGEEFKF